MPFFEDESFQAVVTSPPYWGQRDYGHGPGQLGFEQRPADFALNLAAAFRETKRVLRSDGVLWVVIGDSYNTRTPIRPSAHQAGLGHENASTKLRWREQAELGLTRLSSPAGSNLKDKDLVGIPWRFATAMIDEGWYCRAEIIWSKVNWGKPDNAADRPSRRHETIFLFTKAPRYTFYKTADTRLSVWEIDPQAQGPPFPRPGRHARPAGPPLPSGVHQARRPGARPVRRRRRDGRHGERDGTHRARG